MFLEQLRGRGLALAGQCHGDLAAVFLAALTQHKAIALQPVEQTRDRRPRHAGQLGQLMRRQPPGLIMQQKQQHELSFRQLPWRQPRGAIAVDGAGQRQQLKAQANSIRGRQAAARGLVQQGVVLGFQHLRRRGHKAVVQD
ncbi:hypothetical protein D3C72_1890470 [compost metagenome]